MKSKNLYLFSLWGVLFVLTAGQLRASWDIHFARSLASKITDDLRVVRENDVACINLQRLTVPGHQTAESPDSFHFRSHGLGCHVWRTSADLPCEVVIQIGNPALYRQVVTFAQGGPTRAENPVVSGGLLRSLSQKRGTRQ